MICAIFLPNLRQIEDLSPKWQEKPVTEGCVSPTHERHQRKETFPSRAFLLRIAGEEEAIGKFVPFAAVEEASGFAFADAKRQTAVALKLVNP